MRENGSAEERRHTGALVFFLKMASIALTALKYRAIPVNRSYSSEVYDTLLNVGSLCAII